MNVEQTVIEYLRKLPPDKQQEVLEFTQFLHEKRVFPTPDTTLTLQHQSANWLAWVESHTSHHPPLPEEALHRDTMYED